AFASVSAGRRARRAEKAAAHRIYYAAHLCCSKIPFSFEVDRYKGQPANSRLTFIHALLPEREPPVIVRDSGRDELGTDSNQRILPQLSSSEFSRTIHYHTGPALQSSEQFALHAAIL